MTTPFERPGTFAPTTGEKNARTTLIEFVANHGWLLDLTATRSVKVWRDAVREQDPNQFIRDDGRGGHWIINLDYEVKGDGAEFRPIRKWDNTLRGLRLWHSSWVDERGVIARRLDLRNYHQLHVASSDLWDLTDPVDDKFKPLRKRAEEIIRDPDIAAWLIAEGWHRAQIRDNQRKAEKRRERMARQRPLGINIDPSRFKRIAHLLKTTGETLRFADGLTDLDGEVAKAEKAVAALRAALERKDVETE